MDAEELEAELKYWKQAAVYLADCHAATGFDYEKKSADKGERARIILVLEACAGALKKEHVKGMRSERTADDVIERCNKTTERLRACS